MKVGMIFTGKYFTGRVEVLEMDEKCNSLQVSLTMPVLENGEITEFTEWCEEWDLQHSVNGFEVGDYFVKEFKGFPPALNEKND